jgi:hypothetical protein
MSSRYDTAVLVNGDIVLHICDTILMYTNKEEEVCDPFEDPVIPAFYDGML